MENTPAAIKEVADSVKRVEGTTGQELMDELAFSKSVYASYRNFATHLSQNTFLEDTEKAQLASRVDAQLSGILKDLSKNLSHSLQAPTEREAKELALKAELLSTEAKRLVNGLLDSVESQLRSKQTGFEGVSDGEFTEIIASLSLTQALPDCIFAQSASLAEALSNANTKRNPNLIFRTELNGEVLYVKSGGQSSLDVFTVTAPKLHIKIAAAPLPSLAQISTQLEGARESFQKKSAVEKVHANNLRRALSGQMDALETTETGWDKLSPTETMTIESAYNMGMEAAVSVKMQLLLFKVAKKKGYSLPAGFALDGDWGSASNTALKSIFAQEHLPYTEDLEKNLKTLRDFHHKEFPADNTELFLTPEEIKSPQYKFENKGVYRGLKVKELKARLLENGFNLEALSTEGVYGNELSPNVKEAFPKVMATLKKLTSNKDLQASIVATMIMETGLSSTADAIGLGRGDRKDYARYVDQNWPRLTAAVNEYSPMRLETNSSGIMQINYQTAQRILQEKLGQYYSKDMLVSGLESSVELSTVMAFMVYQDSQTKVEEAKALYAPLVV